MDMVILAHGGTQAAAAAVIMCRKCMPAFTAAAAACTYHMALVERRIAPNCSCPIPVQAD